MLSRERYKQIKAMNREELDSYLNILYLEGYKAGAAAVSASVAPKIDRGIRNTPGIGEKRYDEIMKNISAELNNAEEGDQNEQD